MTHHESVQPNDASIAPTMRDKGSAEIIENLKIDKSALSRGTTITAMVL